MAYGDFKDLPRRSVSNKLLRDKVFNIAKIRIFDGYQREFASMVYTFNNKNCSAGAIESETILSKQLG